MDKIKFAILIGYVTMIANRNGPQCLTDHEISEVGKLVDDLMPVQQSSNGHATQEAVNELLDYMRKMDGLIPSIKAYRALTNAGLKEAKEAVERYR